MLCFWFVRGRRKYTQCPSPVFSLVFPAISFFFLGGSGQGNFVVLYDYTPVRDDECALTAGSKVIVLERNDEGWARGTCGETSGWFPANYISDSPDAYEDEKVSCMR